MAIARDYRRTFHRSGANRRGKKATAGKPEHRRAARAYGNCKNVRLDTGKGRQEMTTVQEFTAIKLAFTFDLPFDVAGRIVAAEVLSWKAAKIPLRWNQDITKATARVKQMAWRSVEQRWLEVEREKDRQAIPSPVLPTPGQARAEPQRDAAPSSGRAARKRPATAGWRGPRGTLRLGRHQ